MLVTLSVNIGMCMGNARTVKLVEGKGKGHIGAAYGVISVNMDITVECVAG